MSSTISITYGNNAVNINDKSYDITKDFHFFNLDNIEKQMENPDKIYSKYTNYDDFEKFQKNLRYLDCLKDFFFRTTDLFDFLITDSQNKLIPPNFNNFTQGSKKKIVEKLEESIIEKINKDEIKNISWIKDGELNPKQHVDYIFFETGLDPIHFIHHNPNALTPKYDPNPNVKPTYIRNLANDVIDPFKRKCQKVRKHEIFGKDTPIKISKNFMDLFGFNEKITKFDYVFKKDKYDFNITTQFNGREIKLEDNMKFFSGNNEKAEFLESFVGKTKNDGAKNAFILAKELGDVMQVLIMYIWSKYYKKDATEYTMVTHDRIVYLFCQLLKQPCHYFENTDSTNKSDTKDNTKMRNIQYYLPVKDTPELKIKRLTKKFEETKADIVEINKEHIRLIENLIRTGQFDLGQPVRMNEKHKELLSYLIRKINQSNRELSEISVNNTDTEEKINKKINDMVHYRVGSIFHNGSTSKIKALVKIGSDNLDYRDEMNKLSKDPRREITEKYTFGKLLQTAPIPPTQSTQAQPLPPVPPIQAKTKVIPMNVEPQGKPISLSVEEKNMVAAATNEETSLFKFLNKISSDLLTELVNYKNSFFQYVYDDIFLSPPTRFVGGRGIVEIEHKKQIILNDLLEKYKQEIVKERIDEKNNKSFITADDELTVHDLHAIDENDYFINKQYLIKNLYDEFVNSDYGYEILNEFFQLNLLEQLHAFVKKSVEHKNRVRFIIQRKIIFDTPRDNITYVKDLFGELYSYVVEEFNLSGHVLYDEKLYKKVEEFCEIMGKDYAEIANRKKIKAKRPQTQQQLYQQISKSVYAERTSPTKQGRRKTLKRKISRSQSPPSKKSTFHKTLKVTERWL